MKPNYVPPPRVKPPRDMPAEELARIKQYIETAVPELHKLKTERALTGQLSRAAAMKVKCLTCCNFERAEVAACRIIICPLHSFRPYQGKSNPDTEDLDDDTTA